MERAALESFGAHGMASLLEVQNLGVGYSSHAAICPALVNVSFQLAAGEILGVLGESGSGKSTLAAALLRLLPANGKIVRGKILFEGQNILELPAEALRRIRGGRIGLINQEPSSALHPAIRTGRQISNVLAAHESLNRAALGEKTGALLGSLFPSGSERISTSYPHQLSGGQRQRILIAQAIASHPALVLADEPTASLDPITQREILLLFRNLQHQLGLAMIFITHNPALLVNFAHRVLVLYAGRVAEIGPASQVLSSPQHPYTAALLRCLPAKDDGLEPTRKGRLLAIPGDPPDSAASAKGCPFEPRCEFRMAVCRSEDPQPVLTGEAHTVSCFKFHGEQTQ